MSHEQGCADRGAARQRDAAVYRQCARCGAPIEVRPTPSHAARDGTLWSDGYRGSPDLFEPSLLGKCRVCEAIGCLEELPVIEEVPRLALDGDYSFVPLTVGDYASLLEEIDEISAPFHLYLRVRFWQLNNHRRRGSEEQEALAEVERENLIALHELLGAEDPHRLVKAEILRQLGEFERAESLLAEPVMPALASMSERMKQLLAVRNSSVVKLFSGASGDEIPAFMGR